MYDSIPGHRVKVLKDECECTVMHPSWHTYVLPSGSSPIKTCTPFVFSQCSGNLRAAVAGRVDKHVNLPDRGAVSKFRSFVRELIRRGAWPQVRSSTDEEVFARAGPLRAKLELGCKRYHQNGLPPRPRTPIFVKGEKTFLSREKCPQGEEGCFKDKPPRIIFNIPPEYAYLGSLVYHNVEAAQLKAKGNGLPKLRSCFKGLDNKQRAMLLRTKWKRFRNPVAICGDGKQCDAHMSKAVLSIQHMVDCHMNPDPRLRLLQASTLKRWILKSPDLRVLAPVMRLTGAWDTGGGNTLLHLLCLVWCLEGLDYELAVDGDDFVIICEADDLGLVQKALEKHTSIGFSFELDPPVTEFEKIDFCRARPVQINAEEYYMVRNPTRVLANALGSWEHIAPIWSYLKTVSDGERRAFQGIPILGTFFERRYQALKHLPDYKGRLDFWGRAKLKQIPKDLRVDPTFVRPSFYRAWGFSLAEQLRYEAQYEAMDFSPTKLKPLRLDEPVVFNPRASNNFGTCAAHFGIAFP